MESQTRIFSCFPCVQVACHTIRSELLFHTHCFLLTSASPLPSPSLMNLSSASSHWICNSCRATTRTRRTGWAKLRYQPSGSVRDSSTNTASPPSLLQPPGNEDGYQIHQLGLVLLRLPPATSISVPSEPPCSITC